MRSLALTLLLAPALAWSPSPDNTTAQQIVDSAYSRVNPVATVLSLPLKPTAGSFPQGSDVSVLFGEPSCLLSWKQNPNDFVKNGSRPISITLAGQAYQINLVAQAARNAFRNISGKDALAQAQQRLPMGHLQVYIQMEGLAQDTQRGAYNVGIALSPDNIVRPYRTAFLEDWKRSDATAAARWSGTMLYYFDLSKASFDPKSKIGILVQTEADADCTYSITADLSKFY